MTGDIPSMEARLEELREELAMLESLRSRLGDDVADQKVAELESEIRALVNTGGGALVAGDATVERGDFVGRDKWQVIFGDQYLGVPPDQMPPEALLGAYLRKVQTTCNALPLAVIDPRAVERTRQQTMDLLAVYVDLDTETLLQPDRETLEGSRIGAPDQLAAEEERELAEAFRREEKARPLTAVEAVSSERQMVLLGQPGGGKSTFTNYLALCLAGARLEEAGEETTLPGDGWLQHLEPAWSHGPLLPLRVTLRLLAASGRCDGTAAGLWAYIAGRLAAEGLGDFAPHLRQRLLDGGVLVICDGLDEVADPADRKAVRDAVADFRTTYGHPHNRFLVTCRVYAYQDPCWHLDGFAVHTLAPFSQKQIDAFVDCWYQEMRRLGWKTESEAQKRRGACRRRHTAPTWRRWPKARCN